MITRDQAYTQLTSMLSNPNLIKHCLAVESAMIGYAQHFQIPQDQHESWAIAGLIHDADWEKYPQEHPKIIVNWLKDHDANDQIVNAVESHGFAFGVDPTSLMARSLRAVDELTGLITAVALVKNRSLAQVTLESILKKWNQKGFAAGASREDIQRGADELGIPLNTHIQIVLSSMQKISATLNL